MYHFSGHNWSFYFFFEWGPFAAAGLSFKATSLPLCIPLHSLAHFTVPKKFWKSAIWQSTIRRLLLKIGWWLTLERLLHTQLCVWAAFVQLFMLFFFRGGIWFENHVVVCFPRLWTCVGHLSDLELMHRLGWHTLTSPHTHPLSISPPSWLAWIFLLIPQLLSSCVAV